MSSMLNESCLKSRLYSSRLPGNIFHTAKLLKLSAVFILLLAVLCMIPAGAESIDMEGLPETERNSINADTSGIIEKLFVQESIAENLICTSSGRETNYRLSQKKNPHLQLKYQSYADERGNVVFAESRVVTGMYVPDGTSGIVSLYPKPLSAGPKCRDVFAVFSISIENYPAGYESVIRYTLPLDVIEDSGFSPAEICLYYYEAESWEKLPTEYYIEDTNAFFESVTTAPGIFAVVSDECSSKINQVMIRSDSSEYSPVTLEISPVCILTHPMSYTAPAV